jgi:ATP-dependent helicase/nuclease subunit B
MASRPRVFNIPASAPFLPTLIRALMDDRLGLGFKPGSDPMALATATIYLPTRRACRLAQQMFLDVLERDAAILPRIVPIGDVDEDEIAFADEVAGGPADAVLDLPEPLGGLERKVMLAQLILKWAASPEMRGEGNLSLVANSPASALALAGDLARLMDDMLTRQVPWDRLDTLVPDDLGAHWQKTLRFLKIAREYWPAALQERGKIEPAEQRDTLIAAEARRLAAAKGPVIAAGSTGSIPATATLLDTIAKLPHGVLVLPGLDTDLDEATWRMIASDADVEVSHGHPQFAMHALLRKIGVVRDSVGALAQPEAHGRECLMSEALRPAAASELWQGRLKDTGFAAHADKAMENVAMIEAANAEEEALSIATALREAVETPGKTAALVTPDGSLARRVLAALARWNVPVDDSGGNALADTPAGVFARLVAETAFDGLAPVTLLALLKHPMGKLDIAATATLERAILRGTRPKRGTAGLEAALNNFRDELAKYHRKEVSWFHRSDPRVEITKRELDAATDLVAKLKAALTPLESLPPGLQPFNAIAELHAKALLALGHITDELAEAFDEIAAAGALPIEPRDYPELFEAAVADRKVRRPKANVRVRIYGAIESRLQYVDRLVLGGLVEGVWPPETRSDPWLSRPMRQQLGLDLPERRIGLSAHDFAQALGAPEVILTRAAKQGGAPTVASRFVQRLAAVAGHRWTDALERGARYTAMARLLDGVPLKASPLPRPEPKPPRNARPMSLSVTEIETWLRDPYSIYARHVLRLRPLDTIDAPPGARDRGTVVHGAIGDFTLKFKDKLPDDVVGELLRLGEAHFSSLQDFPDAKAFWWPRFKRVADWFAGFESKRRGGIAKIDAEIHGTIEIPVNDRVFVLRARADRIEHRTDGRFAILDYKTGQTSSAKEVRSGLAPQLSLEGAILRAGRFGDIPAGESIAEFMYVALRGVNPPGEERPMTWKDTTPDEVADTAARRLAGLVAKFDNPDTPYRSRERPQFMRRGPGDYDHLSRTREWSLFGDADDEGAAE